MLIIPAPGCVSQCPCTAVSTWLLQQGIQYVRCQCCINTGMHCLLLRQLGALPLESWFSHHGEHHLWLGYVSWIIDSTKDYYPIDLLFYYILGFKCFAHLCLRHPTDEDEKDYTFWLSFFYTILWGVCSCETVPFIHFQTCLISFWGCWSLTKPLLGESRYFKPSTFTQF